MKHIKNKSQVVKKERKKKAIFQKWLKIR